MSPLKGLGNSSPILAYNWWQKVIIFRPNFWSPCHRVGANGEVGLGMLCASLSIIFY